MTGEHLRANFESWQAAAPDYVAAAEANWAAGEGAAWGIWGISEAQVGMLAELRPGMDAVELGCGTAYVSAWIARRGGRPVGVDQAPAQLATARRLQREHGLEFPLVEADAEAVPLPDASFDFAVSEYGASLWCEPRRWLAEAARLLRPGGVLAFLTSHPLSSCACPTIGRTRPGWCAAPTTSAACAGPTIPGSSSTSCTAS